MKLKSRLAVAFFTITVVPVFLIFAIVMGLGSYQMKAFRKNYDLPDQVQILNGNSIQIFNRMTWKLQEEIRQEIDKDPDMMQNIVYLNQLNQKLDEKYAYLIIRRGSDIFFSGESDAGTSVIRYLPEYGELDQGLEGGIYVDGDRQHLVKQMDFTFSDGTKGSAFIISNMEDMVPEMKTMFMEMLAAAILVLVIIGTFMIYWVYRAILSPLNKLQEATQNIREGNLDFTVEVESDDEIGHLCQNFEDMRIRLKESAEEKVQYDQDNRELISNISHDLKTPITAIKGYVEGIMDGVAASPEKLDKYIRTIYNKANDMDRLINELTYYAQIDTNKIPYNFAKINVGEYFKDCVDEVGLDLDSRNIKLGFFNHLQDEVRVLADPEQLKKVINNIIGNSVKYMDKAQGIITIRLVDDGDFIRVDIEDNGKGIAKEDMPYIFDRFYRTDSSRNSTRGGSGIGLSIVKKIIEDHNGRIWATGKEGKGTVIHFVLRKYQEVNENEQDSNHRG